MLLSAAAAHTTGMLKTTSSQGKPGQYTPFVFPTVHHNFTLPPFKFPIVQFTYFQRKLIVCMRELYGVCMCVHTCTGKHVEVRKQLLGTDLVLSFHHGFWAWNSGSKACVAITVPAEPSCWPQSFLRKAIIIIYLLIFDHAL